GDPFGVAQEVELDDLAVPDRHGADGEGLAVPEGDCSGGAVDERATYGQVDPRPHERLAGNAFRALNEVGQGRQAEVGSQHDIGVEHGDELVEVTFPCSGEEGLDDLPLSG